jgi:hypothetical protein
MGFWTGLGFTLVISAFLILPVLASVMAGQHIGGRNASRRTSSKGCPAA